MTAALQIIGWLAIVAVALWAGGMAYVTAAFAAAQWAWKVWPVLFAIVAAAFWWMAWTSAPFSIVWSQP